jgi:cholesterol oxidase
MAKHAAEEWLSRSAVIDASAGPVITSAIRVGGAEDGQTGRGFYIQDAAYPEFVNWMVQLADVPRGSSRFLRFAWHWLSLRLGLGAGSDLSADIAELVGDSTPSSNSLPMLGMGRDLPDGKLAVDEKAI